MDICNIYKSYNVKIQGQGNWITLSSHHLLHSPFLLSYHVLHTGMGTVRGRVSEARQVIQKREGSSHFMTTVLMMVD